MPDAAPVTITTLPSTPLIAVLRPRRSDPVQRAPCASPCSTRSPSPGRGDPTPNASPTSTRSSRRWPANATAGTPSGPSSTTSSRSTRTAPTPRCSTAPSPPRPSGCGSASACGSCRSRTTTRCARPSRSPCSTSSPTAASTSAPAARSTRAELEGFGIDPAETRGMWQEAIGHVVGCWTNDTYAFEGEHWSMPPRRVQPKPIQQPHPPIWGATSSDDGHRQVGELGLGLCSFAVGVPPESVKEKIDIYRTAIAGCTEPIGKYVHDQASTFTMARVRAHHRGGAGDGARELRVVPEGGRAPHRVGRRHAGRPRRGARHLLVRRRPEGGGRRRLARLHGPRVPRDQRGLRARHPRPVHRDVPALRGGRRRPAAVPREPVQDPARRR